jgi:hypothetical protein
MRYVEQWWRRIFLTVIVGACLVLEALIKLVAAAIRTDGTAAIGYLILIYFIVIGVLLLKKGFDRALIKRTRQWGQEYIEATETGEEIE